MKMPVSRRFALIATLASALGLSACGGGGGSAGTPPVAEKVTITDLTVGTGPEAVNGKSISVHYTGWLFDAQATGTKGKKIDSSVDRGQPFTFVLGAGQVIKGWDQGVVGMKVGGKRNLVIPASLAYGATGANGVIPPNATLIFDVELLGVQ
jgi:FKBP-type peptidyl-prolyl cis-trans isomerase